MRLRGPMRGVVALPCAALLAVSGCARFDNAQSQPFTTEPELRPGPSSTPPPPPPLPPKPFPKECPAPGVMQGCLESTSGLIMLPDSQSALVAERTTGAVKEVSVSAEPKVKTVIPVDGSGDGGLMDIVLSPTYSQDRLMYAYISTPTDNRVVRIADGDIPKPILTGIPKGATGNTGALVFTSPTTLVVQTGDAGDPGAGGRPGFAGGQGAAHRAADDGQPGTADHRADRHGCRAAACASTRPTARSTSPTARRPPTACSASPRNRRSRRCGHGRTSPAWPGCAALDGTVLVNLVNTKQTVAVRLAPETGAVTGEPEVVRQDQHGHAWALQLSPDGNVWGATVNKTAGDPEKLDDVVFPLFPQGGFPPQPTKNPRQT